MRAFLSVNARGTLPAANSVHWTCYRRHATRSLHAVPKKKGSTQSLITWFSNLTRNNEPLSNAASACTATIDQRWKKSARILE